MLKVFIVIGDGGEFYHELIDHGYPDGNEKAFTEGGILTSRVFGC